MAVESPGSLNDFAERSGLEINQAIKLYEAELDGFRHSLAASMGITVEDLHELSITKTEGTSLVEQVPELI